MFDNLLSVVTFPFNNLVVSMGLLASLYTIRMARIFNKTYQDQTAMVATLPGIDVVANDPNFPVEPAQKNAAKMLQTLKAAAPKNGAHSLTKIGFRYEEKWGHLANTIGITKTGQYHTMLIGQNALKTLTKKELFNILTHELGHVLNADVSSNRRILEFINSTNSKVFMLGGLTTTALGIKSLFYWSDQLPSMLQLMLVSTAIAQAYKMYNRRIEFRADQNVLAMNQDPEALISGIQKCDKLDEEWLKRYRAALPASERNIKEINFETFFPPYPSNQERKKALGIIDHSPAQASQAPGF